MTELSPAAQQVFWEFNRAASGKPDDWHYLPAIAAALRAAVEQVVPHLEEPDWGACNNGHCDIELYTDHQRKRAQLLAIAAELEQSEPEFTATPTHKQRRLMTSRFDRRIGNTPDEWRGPLADVVDTADAVRLAMEDWGVESPELLLGLTQLVLHRFDAAKARSDAH